MMKNFNQKYLVGTVSALMTLAIASSTSVTHASDIEIYKLPDKQQKTIMLMLDTSGSMSVYPIGKSACDIPAGVNYTGPQYGNEGWLINTEQGIADSTQQTANSFHGRWCQVGDTRYYDRMTKLKSALVDVVRSTKLDDSVVMGIGTFAPPAGTIRIPARPLTKEHRDEIYNHIRGSGFGGSGGTPTANAYAEVAAYMLGTTTAVSPTIVQLKPETIVTPAQNVPAKTYTRQTYVQGDNRDLFWICHPKGQYTTGLDETGACRNIAGSASTIHRSNVARSGYTIEQCRAPEYSSRECLVRNGDTVTVAAYTIPATTSRAVYDDLSKQIGFNISASTAKSGDHYISPLPTTGQECSGQAIYFLTDGFPNGTWSPQFMMKKALGSKGGDFPMDNYTNTLGLNNSLIGNTFNWADELTQINISGKSSDIAQSGWMQIGEFSRYLRTASKNPAGVSIPTAVVGYGGDFSVFENASNYKDVTDAEGKTHRHYNCAAISNHHARYSCQWGSKPSSDYATNGGYGEGGFYYAKDGNDVVNSILEVVDNIDIEIPTVATGSPTVPVNELNRQEFLPYAYYSSFTPRPESQQQLWVGNINKYDVVNGELRGTNGGKLVTASGQLDTNVDGKWTGGVKGQLPFTPRLVTSTSPNDFNRKVLTNRALVERSGVLVGDSTGELSRVSLDALYGDSGRYATDPKKNYWLNVLGYQVAQTATTPTQAQLESQPVLRQLAATMHSSPILLTQSGRIQYNAATKQLVSDSRSDFVMFGTTDGMLHVVDDRTGVEKFAFLPNEMMEKAPEAFLIESATNGGSGNLFYGIDAPWAVHSQFVAKADGTLTVGDSGRRLDGDNSQNLKGHQWIYGGLRMGGKSYYALDLSNINDPKLKFQIDPANKRVLSGANVYQYDELSNMGQSWSKPSLGYVNWKGQRRFVMFVGGGYDGETTIPGTTRKGYEQPDYQQTNGIGAGVYMFDAETGELLWSAGKSNTKTTGVERLVNDDLQYSVAGRIGLFDSNSDGLIDHLYFGDLAGQAFRVDINNKWTATDTANIQTRITRIFNEHKTDGTSPRFYEMPIISVYKDSNTGTAEVVATGDARSFATVAFTSGDKSSPFSAGTYVDATGNRIVNPTATDGVFVYYDNDISRYNINANNFSAKTLTDALANLDISVGVPQISNGAYNRGWKYLHRDDNGNYSAGRYKGIGEPYVFRSMLFTSVYDKDGVGLTNNNQCGGGVRGNSELHAFCLPTGKCDANIHGFDTTTTGGRPIKSELGAGLLSSSIGGSGDRLGVTSIVPDKKENTTVQATDISASITTGITNLTWSESR